MEHYEMLQSEISEFKADMVKTRDFVKECTCIMYYVQFSKLQICMCIKVFQKKFLTTTTAWAIFLYDLSIK